MTTSVLFTYGTPDTPREILLKEGEEPAVLLGIDDKRLIHEDGSTWNAMDCGTHGSLVKVGPDYISINMVNATFDGRKFGFPQIISVTHTTDPKYFRR